MKEDCLKSDVLIGKDNKKNDVTLTEMVPPDGGWGWIVLFGNCILMFLLPTSPVCYGVVYLTLIEHHGISNTTASGITAVLLGISTILGPISTAMSSFYSHRRLAVIGVSFMVLGLLFSSLSLNIFWLYFSFVIIGFGNGLGTPQIFLIGQEYFTTKRVTANAVASVAYTVGYVVLPIVLTYLIYSFSLRGAFLIWAGIMCNGVIGAMLYHPVERHLKQITVNQSVTFSDTIHTIEDGVSKKHDNDNTELFSYANGHIESNHREINQRNSNNQLLHEVKNVNRKIENFETDSLQSTKEEDNYDETKGDEYRSEEQSLLKYSNCLAEDRPASFVSTTSIDSYCTAKTHFKSMVSVAPSEYFDVMGSWLSIRTLDEFKPINGSVAEIPEYTEQECLKVELPFPEEKRKFHKIFGIRFPYFSDIINVEVLTSPVFLIIAISSAVYRQLYYGYSSFLPVIAYQKELEEYIPLLLIVLAIAEIVSKFSTGFIVDRGWLTAKKCYIGSTLINCFALILSGLSKNLSTFAVATSILGIGLGISSSLGPVLLVKYHSLDLLAHSYGLMLFLSGATTFVLLPIQGWTIDETGSANYVCFIFASLLIIPCILWSLMPLAKKRQATNDKK